MDRLVSTVDKELMKQIARICLDNGWTKTSFMAEALKEKVVRENESKHNNIS